MRTTAKADRQSRQSRQPKKPGRPRVTARSVALGLLGDVLERGRPLDESIAGHRGFADLSDRDRAFARQLLATVIRRLGQIDDVVDRALAHPLKPGMATVRNILRLGTAQILFLKTAPHAAVAATVDLAGGRKLAGVRGLINAVLRRLVRDGQAWVGQQNAARLNTPDWLWSSWCGAYGEAAASAIAARHLEDPPLDLSFKPGEDLDAWADKLGASKLPGGSLRLASGHGPIERLPGFGSGNWWVQDIAASLTTRFLGEVKGRRVVDLCAAPGGKTAGLAAAGARVTAVDRSETRMSLLRANLSRLGLDAETVVTDGTAWRPKEPADMVLLDAPCSGTGTLRRHPDIARLKREKDVASLAGEQDKLLRAAVEICAPGGLILYAVCSLQPEEGPERTEALLRDGAPVEPQPIKSDDLQRLGWPAGNGFSIVSEKGELRTLPHLMPDCGGMDGFYARRFRRL